MHAGDRVRIVSLGEHVTPAEWVGAEGVVVTTGVERDAWWRVRLDGDKVTTRFYGAELIGTSPDAGSDE